MLRTLQRRMLLAFLAIAVAGVLLLSIMIHHGVTSSFGRYLDARSKEQVSRMVEILTQEYRQKGEISPELIGSLLHQQAMTEGLYYRVSDGEGKIIADSTGMMGMMGMMGGASQGKGAEPFSIIPLTAEGKSFGQLAVYRFEATFPEQAIFMRSFFQSLILSALAMLLVSILLSLLFSRALSTGLRQLGEAARALKGHQYEIRLRERGQPQEIKELFASFHDLARSLQRQERLRREFTNDLAHELRTPLATLRSQIEAMRDGVMVPSGERLLKTHEELMRLVRLVDEMERLLVAENPNLSLRKERIDLQSFLEQLIKQIDTQFEEKGISLSFLHDRQGTEIFADRDRLMQIMMNLMNNAFKYTPPGGEVKVILRGEQDRVEIEVKDTGIGISGEDLPHIFERFYRGDKSRDRRTGGTGIGLSIVKALVEAHHGEIHVISKPGEGSRFILSFPAMAQ